jgi:hypothetical protein
LIALPVIAWLAPGALLLAGQLGHSTVLKWLAVPAGIGWGAFPCWWSGRTAEQRLAARGPEIFARLRT